MNAFVYWIIVGLTTFLSLFLSVYILRWRFNPGVKTYATLTLCNSFLAGSEFLSMISLHEQTALFWYNLRILFVSSISILWVVFVCQYYQKQRLLNKKVIYTFLALLLFANVVHFFFPSWDFWLKAENTPTRIDNFWLIDTSTRIPGSGLYGFILLCTVLLLIGIVIILINFARGSIKHQWIAAIMITGAIIPIIASIVPVLLAMPKPSIDFIVIGIFISSIFEIIAIKIGFLRNSFEYDSKTNLNYFPTQEKAARNVMTIIFVVIASCITIFGITSYRNYANQYRQQVENQLTSISLLKINQIVNWRSERFIDANYYLHNVKLSELIETYLENPQNEETKNLIQLFLGIYSSHIDYSQIGLLDLNGFEILPIKKSIPEPPIILQNMQSSFETKESILIDFYRKTENSPVVLTMIIPLFSSDQQRPSAAIYINIDPNMSLYPLILQWPVPSETGETAIIRAEENGVLYLSNLRFEENTVLKEKISLDDVERPSVKAVLGNVGIVEGINYRGHQVIADVQPIPDSPWYLVSRIDKAEALNPLGDRGRLIWIINGLLILSALLGIAFIWRQQMYRASLTKNQLQIEIAERDRKLQEAQELAHLGFWYWDVKTGDVEWSEQVYKIFRLDQTTFKPKIDSILALSPWPEDQKRDQELIERAIATRQPGMYEQKFLRPDQSIGYYSSTFQGIFDENDQLSAIVGSVIDITERTLQDKALRESEMRFRTLFEHAAVGVVILNPHSEIILDANQKFCEMVGYKKSDLVGTSAKKLSINTHQPKSNKLKKALIDGKINEYYLEKQYLRKNGETIWISQVVSSLWDSHDSAQEQQLISMEMDITDRKKIELELRESEKKFRETVENLDEGYFRCTIEGELLDFNQSYQSILGFAKNQNLLGISSSHYWKNIDQRKHYLDQLSRDGSVTSYQVEARKISGEPISILISSHLLYDNKHNPIQIEGVILDISPRIRQEEKILSTQRELQRLLEQADQSRKALLNIIEDQKIAQQEINLLNRTLEDRVEQRTIELKTSNEELESFAYSISHDLRAPLRAIDGYSRILEQDYSQNLDTEGLRLLNIIRLSTKNMDELITNLLALSRVGRSELKFSLLNMQEIVTTICAELTTPEITDKVTFHIGQLPEVVADPTLIKQVWVNLISNAIKYSMPKENPEITIFGTCENSSCTYGIKDNGVGFNPDHQDKLFGLFQRLHKASEFEGTGVGLAIVQRIIRRHAGQVSAKSTLGEGAEFIFTIPVREESKNE